MAVLNRIQRAALESYANGNDADKIATNLPGLTVPAVLELVRAAARARLAGDSINDLSARAAAVGSTQIAKLAGRAEQAVKQLRDAIQEHEQGNEVRARISKLEAELAEARKQLSGKNRSGKPATPRSATAQVRQWAAENGHPVGQTGRIPQAVFKAYQEATS